MRKRFRKAHITTAHVSLHSSNQTSPVAEEHEGEAQIFPRLAAIDVVHYLIFKQSHDGARNLFF